MTSSTIKKRDYLFDNNRTLLIFLVVAGHVIETIYRNNWFLEGLKWIIYSFHVPAFVFISGYFSKKASTLKDLIRKLLVPYLVFEVLYYLLYTFVIHKETKLYLLHPKFTLWYLLALFFWKWITPYFKKIPGYFILSILTGVAIGFSSMKDNFLTIPRALVFYPYFLAGTTLERSVVTDMRNRKIGTVKLSVLFGILFVLACVSIFFFMDKIPVSPQIFYGRYSYATMEQTPATGVLLRLLAYGIGFLITYGILLIIPEKESSTCVIGQRTMQIYLFHGLIYKAIAATGIVKAVDTALETVILLLCIVLLTYFLAAKPFTRLLQILCFEKDALRK